MPRKKAPQETNPAEAQVQTAPLSTPDVPLVAIADLPLPPAEASAVHVEPMNVVIPDGPTVNLAGVEDVEATILETPPAYIPTPGRTAPEPNAPAHNNLVHPATTQSILRSDQTRDELIAMLANRNGPPPTPYIMPVPSAGQNLQRDAEMARGRERVAASKATQEKLQGLVAARDAATAAAIAKTLPVARPGNHVPNMSQGHIGARTLRG